jgi:hypothetical protein
MFLNFEKPLALTKTQSLIMPQPINRELRTELKQIDEKPMEESKTIVPIL